jgi:hypothetical protein
VPSLHDDLSKSLESIWEGGAVSYFGNLRRIKLFLNRIVHSIERIGHEVNAEDFIRLELIREIEPNLYEHIYRSPDYFWSREFAFEAPLKGPTVFDKDEAKKERAVFYERTKAAVPPETQYVFQLLADLFPHFARYQQNFIAKTLDALDAEKERRICHPRYFRSYFLLNVPSELFSQKDFQSFVQSVRDKAEDRAVDVFNRTYRSVKGDFTRWHFVHLVENAFDDFKLEVRRGLCRGMAQNSALWQGDAFELLIAISTTRETCMKIVESAGRQELLRAIIRESASTLYTLILLRRLEHDLNSVLAEGEQYRAVGFAPQNSTAAQLQSDLQEIKAFATEHVRERYLRPDAPSVFEQFGSLGSGMNGIEPNIFLFNWQNLGPDAQADERKYLQNLFVKHPKDLNAFLNLMFRVEFIDDYTQLKPLIDYKELSDLITLNEAVLDRDYVEQFRKRYDAEGGPDKPSPSAT